MTDEFGFELDCVCYAINNIKNVDLFLIKF